MDLKKLRYFLAVAESGSMAEASRRLRLVQPALSQQISRLEDQLGVELMERSSRGITVTEQGRILQGYASSILAQVDRATLAVKDSVRGHSHSATIGMPASIATLLGIPLFTALRGRHRPVALTIYDNFAASTEQGLASGKLNCALTTEDMTSARATSVLFATERLFLIQGSGYHGARTMRLDRIGQTPLVLPPAPNRIRSIVQEVLEQNGIEMVLTGEFRSLSTILAAVRSNIAATFLPVSAVTHEVMSGEFTAIDPCDEALKRELYLTAPKDRSDADEVTEIILQEVSGLARRLVNSGFWPYTTIHV